MYLHKSNINSPSTRPLLVFLHEGLGCIEMWRDFPEQVAGVITEAAHVFVEDLAIQGIKEAVHAYRTTDLKEKLARYHGFRLEPIFWRWADTWCSSAFRDWNIESFLKDVIASVLVIQGEEDEYGTIHQVKSIANRVGGYAEELLIPNCRHIPHHQAREVVAREMGRFILEHCVKEEMDMRNKQPMER